MGFVYIIRYFKVVATMREYGPIDSEHKIVFLTITQLTEKLGVVDDILKNGFHFADSQTLHNRLNQKIYLIGMFFCSLF